MSGLHHGARSRSPCSWIQGSLLEPAFLPSLHAVVSASPPPSHPCPTPPRRRCSPAKWRKRCQRPEEEEPRLSRRLLSRSRTLDPVQDSGPGPSPWFQICTPVRTSAPPPPSPTCVSSPPSSLKTLWLLLLTLPHRAADELLVNWFLLTSPARSRARAG